MTIHEFYYNEENRRFYVEFSTEKDGDKFYRILELSFKELEYYSPDLIDEIDLNDMDEDFIIEIINQYSKSNDLPEELFL